MDVASRRVGDRLRSSHQVRQASTLTLPHASFSRDRASIVGAELQVQQRPEAGVCADLTDAAPGGPESARRP